MKKSILFNETLVAFLQKNIKKLTLLIAPVVAFCIFIYLYIFHLDLTRFSFLELEILEGVILFISTVVLVVQGQLNITKIIIYFLLLSTVKYELNNLYYTLLHFVCYLVLFFTVLKKQS